jgi:hypothetical protein
MERRHEDGQRLSALREALCEDRLRISEQASRRSPWFGSAVRMTGAALRTDGADERTPMAPHRIRSADERAVRVGCASSESGGSRSPVGFVRILVGFANFPVDCAKDESGRSNALVEHRDTTSTLRECVGVTISSFGRRYAWAGGPSEIAQPTEAPVGQTALSCGDALEPAFHEMTFMKRIGRWDCYDRLALGGRAACRTQRHSANASCWREPDSPHGIGAKSAAEGPRPACGPARTACRRASLASLPKGSARRALARG